MTWVKLDDHFTENPKVRTLSDRSFRLYVASLCHCGAYLTDGRVERHKVSSLLPKVLRAMTTELLNAGLWFTTDEGFEVKDYLKYNPSRAQVLRDRDAAVERKRKWAEKNAAGNGVPNSAGNGAQNTTPTTPDPSRRDKGRVSEEPSAVAVALAAEGGATPPETKLDKAQVDLNVGEVRAARSSLRAS